MEHFDWREERQVIAALYCDWLDIYGTQVGWVVSPVKIFTPFIRQLRALLFHFVGGLFALLTTKTFLVMRRFI